MSVDLADAFRHLKNNINKELFFIPFNDRKEGYFPAYLANRLQCWLDKYKSDLEPLIHEIIPITNNEGKDATLKRIVEVTQRLPEVVEIYYKGKVLEATIKFNQIMDDWFVPIMRPIFVPEGTDLYRSRPGVIDKQFGRQDLFHLPFEKRHLAGSNRYSIPGYPALYLSDSTYACWEESKRFRLRDLHFSRFVNTRSLRVIDIRLIDDFYNELINDPQEVSQVPSLFKYIAIFPLILACTVRVLHPEGNFKPEYIIPQLLLQYVSTHEKIDGIRFPSTRINYDKLTQVSGYNYVFPVRSNHKSGFCDKLSDTFHLTEPTSVELEEVIFNTPNAFVIGGDGHAGKYFELIEGVKSPYGYSSFGKLETVLKERPTHRLPVNQL